MTFKKIAGCGRATGERKGRRPGLGLAGHVRHYKKRDEQESEAVSEYNSYSAMRQRCYVKTYPAYPNYGGRGIQGLQTLASSEGEGFRNFIAAMGPRPADKTLDRMTFKDTMNRPTADGG